MKAAIIFIINVKFPCVETVISGSSDNENRTDVIAIAGERSI
jgi:hypothetical protein